MALDLEEIIAGAQEEGKQELRLWLRLLSTTKSWYGRKSAEVFTEFGATLPQFDALSRL